MNKYTAYHDYRIFLYLRMMNTCLNYVLLNGQGEKHHDIRALSLSTEVKCFFMENKAEIKSGIYPGSLGYTELHSFYWQALQILIVRHLKE